MIILNNTSRCCIRIIRLMLQFLMGFFESTLLRVKYGKNWHYSAIGSATIQKWMQRVCCIIGLKISESGQLSQASTSLVVANHVSWLDIIALSSTIKCTFISKNELKKWPLIGSLANTSGTIFINRNNRHGLNLAIKSVTNVLNNGKSVILFPEGTTTNGDTIKNFKSALFQSAINSNCNIQPITIRYIRNNKLDTLAPYIDKNNFFIHLLRIMSQPKTIVHLYINEQILSNNNTRQDLTFKSQNLIQSSLNVNYLI